MRPYNVNVIFRNLYFFTLLVPAAGATQTSLIYIHCYFVVSLSASQTSRGSILTIMFILII